MIEKSIKKLEDIKKRKELPNFKRIQNNQRFKEKYLSNIIHNPTNMNFDSLILEKYEIDILNENYVGIIIKHNIGLFS